MVRYRLDRRWYICLFQTALLASLLIQGCRDSSENRAAFKNEIRREIVDYNAPNPGTPLIAVPQFELSPASSPAALNQLPRWKSHSPIAFEGVLNGELAAIAKVTFYSKSDTAGRLIGNEAVQAAEPADNGALRYRVEVDTPVLPGIYEVEVEALLGPLKEGDPMRNMIIATGQIEIE